jgi:hypothetical protein
LRARTTNSNPEGSPRRCRYIHSASIVIERIPPVDPHQGANPRETDASRIDF